MPTTNQDEIKKNSMKRSLRYCVSASEYANNKSWRNGKTVWRDQCDIVLVQVYMPTTNHDDDEIDKLYEEISEILC